MNAKHRWSFEEDRYCCEKYIEFYVIQKSDTSASDFVRILASALGDIKPTSLRMKVQNIKQIMIEKHIPNSLQISPSANYSKQNLSALEIVLAEYNI